MHKPNHYHLTAKEKLKKGGENTMKKILLSFLLAAVLVSVPVTGVLAATDTVTVTATPGFVGISNSPSTWTLNSISGDSIIDSNTTYYANPLGDTTAPSATVVDGECYFTLSNTSSEATNVGVDISDFTGGSDPMVNSNSGTNGAGTFGAYAWYSGMTYSSKVIAKTTSSDVLRSGLPANTDLKWGMEITTQSDAWTGGTSSTATITITVTAA